MTTHFPVTNSNLSATHLALFLQDKYALSKDTHCRFIRAGINDTYLLSGASGKYVCRVYSLNWRTQTEIMEEIRLLHLLQESNISVSYAIPDKANNYIQTLQAPEGERYAVLFSHAAGHKIHNYTEEAHARVGILMGYIHKVTANQTLNRITYTPDILLTDPLQEIRKFMPADTIEMVFMERLQQHLLHELLNADVSSLRKGIVHMDIWFDNMNITADNTITLFDFDFCGNGWPCMDIAYYILQLHNVEKYEAAAYQPKIDSFLKGYTSVTNISEEEKRLIPMLGICLYFFYLGIQCRRYDNWSNSFLSEDYLKRFINGLVKRYCDIYKLGNSYRSDALSRLTGKDI